MGLNSNKMVVTEGPAPEDAGVKLEAEMPRFQEGGTHDMSDRGIGSGIGVAQRGANDPEYLAGTTEQHKIPDFVQDNQRQEAAEDTDWKKEYGRSENEKGEWRRTASEAMQQLEQMKQELAALRATAPYGQPPQPGYAPPQYQQPPAQATVDQLPATFFPEKGESDWVEVKDVDSMIRSVVAPAVLQIHNQQQELQRQYIAGQKAAAGITPTVEQKLLAECPWMQSIPDGPARVQAMQGYMQVQRDRAAEKPQPQPRQASISPEQAAARRVTYIESGQPARTSESEIPLQQRIAQEFTQAKTAAEKKKVLMKYGMNQVNDWGADVWGPAR